jgi:HEAT repeat protein
MSEESSSISHLHTEAGDFVVSLIQAFLRTGYYLPEHPQSRKAREDLYESFLKIAKVSGQLHFFIRDEGGPTVYVEGPEDSAGKLKDIMPLGMADTYNPRFVNFLERKELVSLTLSTRMDAQEFSEFINLMSEPAFVEMREEGLKEKFQASIARSGIRNISYIFNEDFITVRRDIPWRVSLALSRLHKDLRVLPIYEDADLSELADIKRGIIDDIIRPLQEPELSYTFLMNLDLATTEILPEGEAEDELVTAMEEETFLGVVSLLIGDASGTEKRYRDILPPEKLNRLLGKVSKRLITINNQAANDHLRDLFETGLLSSDNLTPEVRERITLLRLVRSFVDYSDAYLVHLEAGVKLEEFNKVAVPLARIVPDLLEGGWHPEAVSITERLCYHAQTEDERARTAHRALDQLRGEQVLSRAKTMFLQGSKEDRTGIGRFLQLLGPWAARTLLEIVRESDDVWRRKQACDILLQMGREPAASLIGLLEEEEAPGEAVSTVIKILAGIEYDDMKPMVIEAVEKRVRDLTSEVRREALGALSVLEPAGRQEIFLSALTDPDGDVRKEGIRGLGVTADPESLVPLRDTIEAARMSEEEADWDLAAAAILSIGYLREGCEQIREQADEYVLDLAGEAVPRKGLKKLVRSGRGYPQQFLLSLSYTLGRIGNEESERYLTSMANLKDKTLARRARTELEKKKSG